MITPRQIEIMQHALGINESRREPYRNYYVAGPLHYANSDLETLVSLGMMTKSPAPKFCPSGDVVYSCTDTGRDTALSALPPPPKPTRYSEYLDADSCMSFSEWLLGWKKPEVEYRSDGQCRMFRCSFSEYYGFPIREVEGAWANTKKAAKASYKAALRASKEGLCPSQ
ncbi:MULTISPECIES: hypothetical protein [Brenneria]|uniref:Uncharacterized protein n=1 Tax=Brenneria nigrifluens DSM 30175 = ATCC 13028 TaxID=1121120 RepID=A0A2U1UIR9_9GAMM|nr:MULTISPECIES: hypothetical protein [Brenneria]EHD21278.1 hypothetical protein BrE312_1887 [Brenneria sp. EniD312]PWC21492.1 hypothetical protein DDT54_18845 [Brenneria nigrifluens DSM 30175 = ATCC 13028]QCR04415.1 hypothetical protein EH206_09665 [Brenneria nigrifluens DSM 30175 = ATCC 13028]